jgi:uncharacterized membrane protein
MSLAPLLNAAPVIQVHAFAAFAAFLLGIVQLLAPKGTLPHRTIGWIWVFLLATIAISSFWIHSIRMFGPFSLIHLLSIFTLIMLPLAVLAAHRHNVERHRRAMMGIFFGALVIAGAFTFVPGRIMYAVAFGGH